MDENSMPYINNASLGTHLDSQGCSYLRTRDYMALGLNSEVCASFCNI